MDKTYPKIRRIAEKILFKAQIMGPRQVRYWNGKFLTYPADCPRGYGTRGKIIGVYDITARAEWIEEDLMMALGDN